MVRPKAKSKQKEYLSPSEREVLQDEKRDLELQLKEMDTENYGAGGPGSQVDKSNIKREINRIGDAIASRTPDKLRGIEKDRLYKREQELEEVLKEGMPSWYAMRNPTKNPGVVRKHIEWLNRNKDIIDEYRTIQRKLRPFDPKSYEELRKDK